MANNDKQLELEELRFRVSMLEAVVAACIPEAMDMFVALEKKYSRPANELEVN